MTLLQELSKDSDPNAGMEPGPVLLLETVDGLCISALIVLANSLDMLFSTDNEKLTLVLQYSSRCRVQKLELGKLQFNYSFAAGERKEKITDRVILDMALRRFGQTEILARISCMHGQWVQQPTGGESDSQSVSLLKALLSIIKSGFLARVEAAADSQRVSESTSRIIFTAVGVGVGVGGDIYKTSQKLLSDLVMFTISSQAQRVVEGFTGLTLSSVETGTPNGMGPTGGAVARPDSGSNSSSSSAAYDPSGTDIYRNGTKEFYYKSGYTARGEDAATNVYIVFSLVLNVCTEIMQRAAEHLESAVSRNAPHPILKSSFRESKHPAGHELRSELVAEEVEKALMRSPVALLLPQLSSSVAIFLAQHCLALSSSVVDSLSQSLMSALLALHRLRRCLPKYSNLFGSPVASGDGGGRSSSIGNSIGNYRRSSSANYGRVSVGNSFLNSNHRGSQDMHEFLREVSSQPSSQPLQSVSQAPPHTVADMQIATEFRFTYESEHPYSPGIDECTYVSYPGASRLGMLCCAVLCCGCVFFCCTVPILTIITLFNFTKTELKIILT